MSVKKRDLARFERMMGGCATKRVKELIALLDELHAATIADREMEPWDIQSAVYMALCDAVDKMRPQ